MTFDQWKMCWHHEGGSIVSHSGSAATRNDSNYQTGTLIFAFNGNPIPLELRHMMPLSRATNEGKKRAHRNICMVSLNFTIGSFVMSRPSLSAVEMFDYRETSSERQATADENSRIKHRYI